MDQTLAPLKLMINWTLTSECTDFIHNILNSISLNLILSLAMDEPPQAM